MLYLPFLASSPAEAAASPLRLANPPVPPERERLRLLAIYSPETVRGAIHQLHVLRYADEYR